MKSPLTILCVEDNDGHFADLQQMLAAELPRQPIKIDVLYARTLAEAEELFSRADAVMTDVFFPTTTGGQEEPNGKTIVERCLKEKKPVVWVTSTYHHGRKTNPLNEWGREHGLEMFDCRDKESDKRWKEDVEGAHKPWKDALFGLLHTILSLEMGEGAFSSDGRLENISANAGPSFFSANPDLTQYLFSKPVFAKMRELGFPFD